MTTRDSRAHQPHDQQQRFAAKQALASPAVVLNDALVSCVARGFANSVAKSRFTIWACSILGEHVHLVIGRHRFKVEQVVNLLKGEATKQLLAEGRRPLSAYRTPAGTTPTPFAAKCWKVFLDNEPQIDTALRYVEENPEKEQRPRQKWDFVVPFTGLDPGKVWINV